MSDDVALIKERLDLADVIGEYVQLKRTGGYWKGLCPFHQEKTPSFVVTPDKGIWHCFGCSESGDVFTFVRKIEGLDFPETLKLLAERAGVQLTSRAGSSASRDRRVRLYEMLTLTARFYHEILLNQAAGKPAREYLAQRGVTDATLEQFAIGYAPAQWQLLQQFLQKRGYAREEMVAAGLVGKNDRGQHFDRFRGRIMFPIHDAQGRPVAFGGRITPWHSTGQEGKYVNSPETDIYQKRRTVYNLHRAKTAIRAQQAAVVVEGYMDVVLMVQSGIEHVVASSGTAFTAEQIGQLQRFAPALHFAFDADRAGLHAAIAATQAALAAGMRVATIIFPAGQDPADVALADPAQLAQIVAAPRSLISVLIDQLKAGAATDREELLAEIVPLVRRVSNAVAQGEMIQEIAATLHVPEAVIIDRVAHAAPAPPAEAAAPALTATTLTAEQQLLGLLLIEPRLRQALLAQVAPDYLRDGTSRALCQHLAALAAEEGAAPPADAIIDRLPADLVPAATALAALSREQRALTTEPVEREAAALLARLKRRYLEAELRRLQQQLEDPSAAAAHQETLRQFQATVAQLSELEAHLAAPVAGK